MKGQGKNHEKAHLHAISNLHAKFHEKSPSGSIRFLVYKELITDGQTDRRTDKVITIGHPHRITVAGIALIIEDRIHV